MGDKLEKQAQRGDAAKAKLSDPLFLAVIERMKAECIATWAASGKKDAEIRESCWRDYKTVERIVEQLQTMAADGRMARVTIDALNKAA
jgi:hypothetical protein